VKKVASDLLVVANLIDEALEALPYYAMSFEQILGDLWSLAVDGSINATSVECLRPISTAKEVARAIDALPVFPAVALRVLAELRSEDASPARIEQLASRDQVIAASLLRVANSGLHGASREIRTIGEAVNRVGTLVAAQLVIAASMKPLFASAGLRDLWRHSTAAAVCAELAARASNIAPGEAGVLGLIHDVGRLVIHMLPSAQAAAHTRIAEASGCPLVADYLVCGRDHAELGADVLARWNFPVEFVEAVGFHHQLEGADSRFASMLYVAEHLTGSEEDIPSISRLAAALSTTVLPLAECLDLARSPGRVEALLDAA
jgi:HD-like signal output (HDOD) protein